jgi:multimeric flavodoxin WrbA
MNIVVILGSRNPNGQTARAAGALIQGVTSGGGSATQHFLPQGHLERCRQCEDNGWGECRKLGHCVIEDDFAAIVEQMRAADAVVFATPVYFSDLSESMRAFLDRLRRITMHDDGKRGLQGKPVVALCVAGGGGGGGPTCAGRFEHIFRAIGVDLIDTVLARRQNLDMKVPILHATGEWLARTGGRP